MTERPIGMLAEGRGKDRERSTWELELKMRIRPPFPTHHGDQLPTTPHITLLRLGECRLTDQGAGAQAFF